MGIYHRQPFLLAATYKLRSIYFHAVDVDGIFIEGAASHRILGTHLIIGIDSRHSCDHSLHTSSRHIWRQFERLGVECLHAVHIVAEPHYLEFPKVHT